MSFVLLTTETLAIAATAFSFISTETESNSRVSIRMTPCSSTISTFLSSELNRVGFGGGEGCPGNVCRKKYLT
ncbi:hypothetical protein AKJ16_DCAP10912 [Drosera capensis]